MIRVYSLPEGTFSSDEEEEEEEDEEDEEEEGEILVDFFLFPLDVSPAVQLTLQNFSQSGTRNVWQ